MNGAGRRPNRVLIIVTAVLIFLSGSYALLALDNKTLNPVTLYRSLSSDWYIVGNDGCGPLSDAKIGLATPGDIIEKFSCEVISKKRFNSDSDNYYLLDCREKLHRTLRLVQTHKTCMQVAGVVYPKSNTQNNMVAPSLLDQAMTKLASLPSNIGSMIKKAQSRIEKQVSFNSPKMPSTANRSNTENESITVIGAKVEGVLSEVSAPEIISNDNDIWYDMSADRGCRSLGSVYPISPATPEVLFTHIVCGQIDTQRLNNSSEINYYGANCLACGGGDKPSYLIKGKKLCQQQLDIVRKPN